MKAVHLIGRILLGGFMIFSSVTNLIDLRDDSGYAAAMGVPLPQIATIVAMLLLLLAGLSILTGFRPRLGIAVMVLFLVPVTLLMHQFWNTTDPAFQAIQMRFFEENIGLLGAMLTFLAIPTPWPFSLDQRVGTAQMIPEPGPAD